MLYIDVVTARSRFVGSYMKGLYCTYEFASWLRAIGRHAAEVYSGVHAGPGDREASTGPRAGSVHPPPQRDRHATYFHEIVSIALCSDWPAACVTPWCNFSCEGDLKLNPQPYRIQLSVSAFSLLLTILGSRAFDQALHGRRTWP